MGSQRYLFWHDAVHGDSIDRFDLDLLVPANCSMASNLYLWIVKNDCYLS